MLLGNSLIVSQWKCGAICGGGGKKEINKTSRNLLLFTHIKRRLLNFRIETELTALWLKIFTAHTTAIKQYHKRYETLYWIAAPLWFSRHR